MLGAHEEVAATLVLRGSVIAHSTSTPTTIDAIEFQVTNASQSGDAVNLSRTGTSATIITYIDEDQIVNLASGDWLATWIIGSGDLLTTGERVQVRVTLTGLITKVGTSKKFTLQVKPQVGAVLVIEKTTPAEFKTVMNMD